MLDMSGDGSGSLFGSGSGELSSSPSPSLAVIYGVSLVGVLVVAVVAVVMTILCYKRQENAKRYYTFASRLTIEPREGNIRSSMRSNAGLIDLQCERLRKSRESVELFLTGEDPYYSLSSLTEQATVVVTGTDRAKATVGSTVTDEVEGKGMRKEAQHVKTSGHDIHSDSLSDSVAVCQKPQGNTPSQHFSFEDGTILRDYPSSVDLEVAGKEVPQKANIIGYCDIYSSQILQTVPTEQVTTYTAQDKEAGHNLKPDTAHGASKQVKMPATKEQAFTTADKSVVPSSTELVVPLLIVEDHGTEGSMDEPQPPPSPSLKEAQELLNKSLSDLLAISETLVVDDSDIENEGNNDGFPSGEISSAPTQIGPPATDQHQTNTSSPITISQPATHPPSLPLLPPSLPLSDPGSVPASVRASRGSDVCFTELLDPSDLTGLAPELQRALLGSGDFGELQISHV